MKAQRSSKLSHFTFMLVLSCSFTAAYALKVCPQEPLTLTCQTYQDQLLKWNVYVPYYDKYYSKLHGNMGLNEVTSMNIEPMVTLTFHRTSESGMSPLVSQLSINNVTIHLNGTMINCSELNLENLILQTTIHIINTLYEYPNFPEVYKTETFNIFNATIMLEWMQDRGVLYNISVNPNPLELIFNGNTSQLLVLYNTTYNVIIAATLCGQNMVATAIDIMVDQSVTCEYPFLNGSSLYIVNYSEPAFVGTTVLFSCSEPGQVLVGPNTTTCMSDGQWAPDPSQLMMNCKANCGLPPPPRNGHIFSYDSTLAGAVVTYICWNIHQEEYTSQCTEANTTAVCNEDGNWEPKSDDMCLIFPERSFETLSEEGKIAVASSVAVFVVASIVFFIVGFLCGHFCQKERKTAETGQRHTPYYDDVVLRQHEQELELKENVAYAPVHSK